jgi:adenylate kinase
MKNNTELGKLAKSYIDKGELVPDKVTIDMLIDELRNQQKPTGLFLMVFPERQIRQKLWKPS